MTGNVATLPSGWGWRSDLEIPGALSATAVLSFRRAASIPDTVDPSAWLRIEDQKQTSSCVGHAISSCGEVLYWIGTKGQVIQLSRWMAYISAQREDGINGDNGATISGAVTSTEKRGLCLEELCRFTGRYHTNVSQAAWADAETRQIRSHLKIDSFEEGIEWVGGGLGTIIIGIPVGREFMNNSGLIDRVDESGGGHALAICGYRTSGGQRQMLLFNSWNESWGDRGRAWVTERAFNLWCAQARNGRSEVWGVSNMETPEPQDMGWLGYFT